MLEIIYEKKMTYKSNKLTGNGQVSKCYLGLKLVKSWFFLHRALCGGYTGAITPKKAVLHAFHFSAGACAGKNDACLMFILLSLEGKLSYIDNIVQLAH